MKLIIFISLICLPQVFSYKFLFFHTIGTRSHLHMAFPIVKELLNRGHEVTAVYYASAGITHPNYTEVITPSYSEETIKKFSSQMMDNESRHSLINFALLQVLYDNWNHLLDRLTDPLKMPEVQTILQQKYDLFVDIAHLGVPIAEIVDCNVVTIMPAGPIHTQNKVVGGPFNPSYQPMMFHSFNDPTQFSQRLENVVRMLVMEAFAIAVEVGLNYAHRTRIRPDFPGVNDIARNRIKMYLINTHVALQAPEPLQQNVIQIGGINMGPNKPLPEDIQTFLDFAEQGAVLVSFGSALTPSSMTFEKRQMFVEVFRQLKIPIIWKCDIEPSEIEGLPDNVLIKNWLPQQDILNHPNLKVFVSHGGLLSTMEAINYGTVLVGIPFGNDQIPNLQKAEYKNVAIVLEWTTLDAETFLSAIRKGLTDREMQESMSNLSALFRDNKESPLERAIWGLEYVVRHDGADFLKSDVLKLSWYEYLLLDVILVIGLGVTLTTAIVLFTLFKLFKLNWWILRTCWHLIFGAKANSNDKKKTD